MHLIWLIQISGALVSVGGRACQARRRADIAAAVKRAGGVTDPDWTTRLQGMLAFATTATRNEIRAVRTRAQLEDLFEIGRLGRVCAALSRYNKEFKLPAGTTQEQFGEFVSACPAGTNATCSSARNIVLLSGVTGAAAWRQVAARVPTRDWPARIRHGAR